MNFKIIANTIGGIVILILVFAYGFNSDYSEEDVQKKPADNAPAWYLVNANTKSFDTTGRLETVSKSSLVKHFEQKDISLLENPDITNFNEDGSEWYITANNGVVLPGAEEIELTGNAKIRKNSPPVLIESEYFYANTNASYLTTDKPVKIINPESTTTAIGMHADLNQERVKLLNNVQTLYQQ